MENVEKLGIIPARYASTRFPGKPLALIHGVPMIERVYRQAEKSDLDKIVVATDDERIAECVKNFGGNVVMTNPDLPSGTDRCRAAIIESRISAKLVVNIQGDEPLIDPEQINTVLRLLRGHAVNIATLISPALSIEEIENVDVDIAKMLSELYQNDKLTDTNVKNELQKLRDGDKD